MKVSDIKVGDLIYPPQREISLWMQRALRDKDLDETALLLTVVEVRPSTKIDKNGPWTFVKGQYTKEWCKDYVEPDKPQYMNFLARPHTPWKGVSR